jgi:hypothetical protein
MKHITAPSHNVCSEIRSASMTAMRPDSGKKMCPHVTLTPHTSDQKGVGCQYREPNDQHGPVSRLQETPPRAWAKNTAKRHQFLVSEGYLNMTPGRDVWQAAVLMVKRYGDDAMLEASERADQLLDEGDMAGSETWHRILNAIGRLQPRAPAEGALTWTARSYRRRRGACYPKLTSGGRASGAPSCEIPLGY